MSSVSSSLKNIFSAPAVTSTPAHVARKKTWKLFSCLALGATPAALASTLFSSPVLAQAAASANLPVTVVVGNVLQLQTWSNINLTLTPAQMLGGTPNASGGLLLQTGSTTGSTALIATPPAGASAVAVPINPLYYVWTTSSAGANVTVALTSAAGGTLTHSTVAADTMTMAVTAGATANTGGKATGMGNNPLTGTATLTFNLTNAKTAGTYTGGSITITATNQ